MQIHITSKQGPKLYVCSTMSYTYSLHKYFGEHFNILLLKFVLRHPLWQIFEAEDIHKMESPFIEELPIQQKIYVW